MGQFTSTRSTGTTHNRSEEDTLIGGMKNTKVMGGKGALGGRGAITVFLIAYGRKNFCKGEGRGKGN